MSSHLGPNVGWLGSVDPNALAAAGVRCVRTTYQPPERVAVADGRAWLFTLRQLGIQALLLADNDVHAWGEPDPWAAGLRRAATDYGDLVSWWQVMNEPDAGWMPGQANHLEERRDAHPSSWVLSPDQVSARLAIAREELGSDAYIVGPGLVSGHPGWAEHVGWSPVDALACHPYAKDPNTPAPAEPIDLLIEGYTAIGEHLWVTEYDSRTPGMHAAMAEDPRVLRSFAFCWSDLMVPPFGMLDVDGNPKPSYHDFVAALSIAPPVVIPIPTPIPDPGGHHVALPIAVYRALWLAHLPSADWHAEFGIEKFYREGENWKRLGAVTSAKEHRQGSKAWRTFANGVVEWDDATGATIL